MQHQLTNKKKTRNRINFKQEKNQKYERFCEEEAKLRSPGPGRGKKERIEIIKVKIKKYCIKNRIREKEEFWIAKTKTAVG